MIFSILDTPSEVNFTEYFKLLYCSIKFIYVAFYWICSYLFCIVDICYNQFILMNDARKCQEVIWYIYTNNIFHFYFQQSFLYFFLFLFNNKSSSLNRKIFPFHLHQIMSADYSICLLQRWWLSISIYILILFYNEKKSLFHTLKALVFALSIMNNRDWSFHFFFIERERKNKCPYFY
jgi:hypothetical protein